MSTSELREDSNYSFPQLNQTLTKGGMYMPPAPHPVQFIIQAYAVPVLAVCGVIGNTISFAVFTRTRLKKTSCSSYLAAVCISDSGFLCTTLLVNLNVFNIFLIYLQGPCQVLSFGNHVFTFLSEWYLTAMTIEKCIGVYWPLKKSEMCTVFRAKCAVIGLAILAFVCYHYMTWIYAPLGGMCLPTEPEAVQFLKVIDAAVVHIIPYIIIFFLSCLISFRTWLYYKMSRSPDTRLNARRQRNNAILEKEFKTTPMILAVAFVAVCLGFPVGGQRLYAHLHRPSPGSMPSPIVSQIVLLCSFVSAGTKFMVYFVSSAAFRRATIDILCCSKKRRVQLASNTEMQSVGMQTIPECSSSAILEGAV